MNFVKVGAKEREGIVPIKPRFTCKLHKNKAIWLLENYYMKNIPQYDTDSLTSTVETYRGYVKLLLGMLYICFYKYI